jgi:uncharacterized repeat protein (TIGR02543 family)
MKTQKSTAVAVLFAILAGFCLFAACEQPTDSKPQVVAKPTATPAGGNYATAQTVTLATSTEGADIHYTLDGTTPAATSTLYSSPITISETKTLKAIAVKTGMTNSDMLTAAYTIAPIAQTTFTVTFDADGGTPAPASPVTKNPGDAITQPSAMTKNWHTFGGWYTDSARTVPASFPITVTSNVNLYAKWTVNTLTSVADVNSYLASLPSNTRDNPATLAININLGTMTAAGSGWRQLLDAINTVGKYVNLNLSLCTMNGTVFNPDSSVATGKNRIVSLILPAAATSIEAGSILDSTFKDFTNLKSISGANIITIGDNAFYSSSSATGNKNLQNVEFPQVATIGNFAFTYCTSLQSVSLPQATSIGYSAFSGCTGLQSVSFPASATLSTVNPTFDGCTSLTSFTLSGTGALSVIENGRALVRNGTVLVAYPSASGTVTMNTITSIFNSAFSGCTALQSVAFPLVTSIGDSVFERCTALQGASFPQATTIGDNAFSNCTNLQNASFPQAVSISFMAFWRCTSLQSLNIPEVTSIGANAFSYTGTTGLSITMGSSAPTLGYEIFNYITAAKTVTVKVPIGATGYTPFSGSTVTVSGTDTAANWANGFRGGSWNGFTWASTTSGGPDNINQSITVIIEQQ